MASMCSIRSPCRFGDFHFTPNAAHARHGSSCAKKSRVVALEKSYNVSIGLIYLRGVADPKERARAPLGRPWRRLPEKGPVWGLPVYY